MAALSMAPGVESWSSPWQPQPAVPAVPGTWSPRAAGDRDQDLVLEPPQCLDWGPVTPPSQGGLSWLAGDPGAAPNSPGYKEHKETRKEPFTW